MRRLSGGVKSGSDLTYASVGVALSFRLLKLVALEHCPVCEC